MNQAAVVVVCILWALIAAGGVLLLLGRMISKLKQEVSQLRARVQAIETAREAQPRSTTSESSVVGRPPITSELPRSAPPPPPRRTPAPEFEERPRRETAFSDSSRATSEFNTLAAQFSDSALDAFTRFWQPSLVARTSDNRLTDDPNGDFWLIPLESDHFISEGIIVPGPEIIRKWELYYRAMGSLAAKNLLEAIYEVGENSPLRIERPATATKVGTSWRVEQAGRFADH